MTTAHRVTSPKEWEEARRQLMVKEKEPTRLRDELSRERRQLPWMKVEQIYSFEGPAGSRSLADLFEGRSQLAVYHFMFGPDWQAGCKSCSFWADHFDGMVQHLRARDVAFAVISRAPSQKLEMWARRLGWKFPWYSSGDTTFNRDFGVSFSPDEVASGAKLANFGTQPAAEELPGVTIFCRDGDAIYRTYSCYSRGLDALNGTYQWLDLCPQGRAEGELSDPMAWVKPHDEYGRASKT